jgi:hypothetical protein
MGVTPILVLDFTDYGRFRTLLPGKYLSAVKCFC